MKRTVQRSITRKDESLKHLISKKICFRETFAFFLTPVKILKLPNIIFIRTILSRCRKLKRRKVVKRKKITAILTSKRNNNNKKKTHCFRPRSKELRSIEKLTTHHLIGNSRHSKLQLQLFFISRNSLMIADRSFFLRPSNDKRLL